MSDDIVELALPDPVYDLFETSRNGLPVIAVVNRALLDFNARDLFSWHLSVTIIAESLSESMMPLSDEEKILSKLDEVIEDLLSSELTSTGSINTLFLARVTGEGKRELYFFIHDPKAADAALQKLIAQNAETRPWEYEMIKDPEWEMATALFGLYGKAGED